MGEHRSNKTYQSRLKRWVNRLLPYQFKVTHISGRDMGIVDYLSREPNGKPWPESELDERFVVTSIESFHKALDCLSKRLSETNQNIDINVLEHSGLKREINHCKGSSSHGCYDNQFVQNWTKLDRNENGRSSRFQKEQNQKNTLFKIARKKQSVENSEFTKNLNGKNCIQISKHPVELTQAAFIKKMEKNKSEKSKKITNRQNGDRRGDELTEQVTETTFPRTRMVKRGAVCSRQDSDTSDSKVPQVEWRTVKKSFKPKEYNEITSGKVAETNLMSFWDLMGAEKSDNPKNLLELEARTVLENRSRHEQELETNVQPSII